MNIIKPARNHKIILCMIAVVALVGCRNTTPAPPEGFDDDHRLLIPGTTVVSALSDVDGLADDAKWDDSFRLDLIDGVDPSGVVAQGVADSNYFYLHFDIEENDFSSTDMVAIAFNPQVSPNDRRLLLIKPCPSGGAGCPSTEDDISTTITYYVDSDDDGEWEPAAGHGVTAKAATAGGVRWAVEVAIPRGAPFNFPATNFFGFYANILETSSLAVVNQYTWPFNDDAGSTLIFGTPEDLPAQSEWGIASFDTSTGNGVSITSRDIFTNHGPSTISWNEPNTFTAIARNNTLTSGNLVAAEQVRATFRWANFGLPSHSSFQRIPTEASPAVGNPASYQDIPPTGSAAYELNWTVPAADQAFYQANPHWCLQVELDSTDPDTIFYRQQAQVNMNFVETSSPFLSNATIDARGLVLPDNMRQHEYILEERFYNTDKKFRWESKLEGVTKVSDQTYRVNIADKNLKKIGLSVLPPEQVLVPHEEIIVGPSVTTISVNPGQLVTLIKDMKVAPGKPGFDRERIRDLAPERPGVDLRKAAPNAVTSHENVRIENKELISGRTGKGTLMGSWDGFKKSQFVIGDGASLQVPKGAKKLYIRNIESGSQDTQADKTVIKQYITDLKGYHEIANPLRKRLVNKDNLINLGANLPTVIYRGKRNMGGTLMIDGKTFQVHQSAGAFGYIVTGKKAK